MRQTERYTDISIYRYIVKSLVYILAKSPYFDSITDIMTEINSKKVEELFAAGAHFGYSKAKRHPSTKDFVYGTKNRVEVIDLEKTVEALELAKDFVKETTSKGGKVLFVASKNEMRRTTEELAKSVNMPYVANRWIGGTFTNFSEIRKRVNRLVKLTTGFEKGEFGQYTKKERLDMEKEMKKLAKYYEGVIDMKVMPKAIVLIDSDAEMNALKEANDLNVPVIAISNTDCDVTNVKHPIIANDTSKEAVEIILKELVSAIK